MGQRVASTQQKSTRGRKSEGKIKFLFFLFLIDNSLFKIKIVMMFLIIITCIIEMNDNNGTRGGKGELGILCYYKVLSLTMSQYSIFECRNCYLLRIRKIKILFYLHFFFL